MCPHVCADRSVHVCAPPSLPSLQHRHQAVGAFSLWRKPSLQIKWSELNSFTSTIYRPLGPDKEQTIVSRPLGAPKAGQEVAQTGLRELNFYSAPEHLKKLFPVQSKCF